MGLGICLICRKREFVYYLDVMRYPYTKICENCSKRLMIEDHDILKQLHTSFVAEKIMPDRIKTFIERRIELSKELEEKIYSKAPQGCRW